MEKVNKKEVARCKFSSLPESFTVGQVLDFYCEWPSSEILSSPVRIEFNKSPKSTSPGNDLERGSSSLFLLQTIDNSSGKAHFKVTSYRPGNYSSGFKLISDQGVIEVPSFSWKVNSVIPAEKKDTIKPYPPFGPWREAFPIWYWPLLGIILFALLSFIIVRVRTFIKRKKKIREVKKRLKGKEPFREFIAQLNSLTREINKIEGQKIIQKLDGHVRLFLENELYIEALTSSIDKIFKQLKKYHLFFFKNPEVVGFFSEMQKLSHEKPSIEDCEQMLDQARELALFCQEQKNKKEF